jgi:uncharacterized membrane protein YdjX (TVP38/TMEM64 family)
MKPVPLIKSKWQARSRDLNSRGRSRILLLVFVLILVGLIIFAYGRGYFELPYVKAHLAEILDLYRKSPLLTMIVYSLVYVVFAALALPGSSVLSLLGGALFGVWVGTAIVSLASTIGSTLAFLISRYLFKDAIQERYASSLEDLNRRFDEDGLYYLFFLRLNPIIPFFMINALMGLSGISTAAFFWCSQIGMLPGTFLFVNAGTQLSRIRNLSEILSWQVVVSLTLLGVFPLIIKKIFKRFG